MNPHNNSLKKFCQVVLNVSEEYKKRGLSTPNSEGPLACYKGNAPLSTGLESVVLLLY